jgi:hypothetical protein
MTVYLVTPTNGDSRVFLQLENAQKFLNYIKTDRQTQMGWIDSEGRHREILQNEDYTTFASLTSVKVYDAPNSTDSTTAG